MTMKSLQWTRPDRHARDFDLGTSNKVELVFDDYNTPYTRVLNTVT